MEKGAKAKNLHAGHRDRMKDRYLESGAESFATHELLEMLLYSVIPYKDTNPVAKIFLLLPKKLNLYYIALKQNLLFFSWNHFSVPNLPYKD